MAEWMHEIERLGSLWEKGLLTDAQFEAERKLILPSAKQATDQELLSAEIEPALSEIRNADMPSEVFPEPARSELPFSSFEDSPLSEPNWVGEKQEYTPWHEMTEEEQQKKSEEFGKFLLLAGAGVGIFYLFKDVIL